MDNQETEFKRVDELYKVGGASKAEWDAAKTNLDVRKSAYNNLLENTQLVSPLNGVVTARNFDNGDLYTSTQMPVLVVEQIAPVKLMVNVSEPNFPKVSKGMPVTVKLDVSVQKSTIDLVFCFSSTNSANNIESNENLNLSSY